MGFLPEINNCTIAIIGMGYVGLPLAIEFAKNNHCTKKNQSLERNVIGFDTNKQRLSELKNGFVLLASTITI